MKQKAKFRLTEKQSSVWLTALDYPSIRRILLDGGARSTKTVLICLWLLVESSRYPGLRVLAARKHRTAAKKSLFDDTFCKLLQGRHDYRMSESDMEIKHVNGSMMRVDGLDDQDRVDKILGTEYGHIFFNESTQLSWPTVTTVLTRLAQNVPGLVARKAIFDCNPKSQRHWLYKVGVMNVDPDTGHKLLDADTWYRQSFTPYDNPYLPADALATLESLTGTQRRRMLEGVWCESEGAVYDEFDEELHVYSETPKGFENWSLVCGVDFGYTNPFVHLWGRLDHDGRLYIFREHYKAGMTVNEHAGVIKQFERERDKSWTVADHDAEDRATLHQHGIFTRAANKDVAAGINAVKSLLAVQSDGKPRLMIHASCRNLIGEFLDYTWEPPRENRNAKEVPIKDRDHALDALRYMVMQLKRPQPSLVV